VSIEIAHPWWLSALVLAPVSGWVALRFFSSMGVARRWSAAILRGVLIALVAGLLAGVSTVSTSDRLASVVVLDVSGSVRRFVEPAEGPGGEMQGAVEQARGWIERASRSRGPEDLLGVVVFDGRASAVASPTRGDPLAGSFEIEPTSGTDIGGALRYAASLIPPDAAGRLVVVSDGNDTGGDAARAVEELVGLMPAGSLRVDVVPLKYRVEDEVVVESVDVPPRAASTSTVTVRVTMVALSGSRGVLRLMREGQELDINGAAPGRGRRVELGPGRHTELVEVSLPDDRLHRFEAVYEPDAVTAGESGVVLSGDTHVENNRAEAFTLTPGRGSVLIVDGVGGGSWSSAGATLARALEGGGLDVELVGPESVPTSLLALQSHDLVVLQNVASDEVPGRAWSALREHVVELGGGLVMIGGDKSFGAGGWRGTALEPILPVGLDLPERAVVPELAVVFVVDKSGSMSQHVGGSVRTKQEIANEAAAMAIASLGEGDLVGLIAFDSIPEVVVDLGENEDPRGNGSRAMSIGSGGGTNIPPALSLAASMLREADAKRKHVIVLTDGRSSDAGVLPGMAGRLHESGISVSTIGVGEADIETLNEMAGRGGGRFYHALNPNSLPRIFLRAVRVIRQPGIREQPFAPVLGEPSAVLRGVDSPPELGGLALTQRREDPTVTTAMVTPQGEPVLAHWKAGLGTVVAFTSDAHGRWSGGWLDWPGYSRLWMNVAQLAARAPGTNDYELSVEQTGGSLRVRLEAFDPGGEPLDLLNIPASVYGPGGDRVDADLVQTGPGTYEVSVPSGGSGSYITVLRPELAGTRLAPVIGGVSVQSGAEYRQLRSDEAGLRVLADRAGGRVLAMDASGAEALFDREGIEPRRAMNPLWRTLLMWAVLVMLLDVGTRRVAWDRLIGREFGVGLREAASRAVGDGGQRAAGALAALRGGRERVSARYSVGGRVGASKSGDPDSRPRGEGEPHDTGSRSGSGASGPVRGSGGESGSGSVEPREGADGAAEGDSSGLLAAKRRVARRYGADQDSQRDGSGSV